jgi:hypothetical protein
MQFRGASDFSIGEISTRISSHMERARPMTLSTYKHLNISNIMERREEREGVRKAILKIPVHLHTWA